MHLNNDHCLFLLNRRKNLQIIIERFKLYGWSEKKNGKHVKTVKQQN